MSTSLRVVPLYPKQARELIGSRDEELLVAVKKWLRDELPRADDWFEDEIRQGAPTAEQAMRIVLQGGPFIEEYAFQYGYAYERLCRYTGGGGLTSTDSFSSMHYGWLKQVDEGMGRLGINAVSVEQLAQGTLPDPLPFADMPRYGEWSHEACTKGVAQWDASTSEQRAALDPEVREAVGECVLWMQIGRANPGKVIAGFYF
ncbi:MAG: hypothetical protein HOY79_02550 [Streptomyces sp.]|nr:hypothetical protein [Streptomyces sp.]